MNWSAMSEEWTLLTAFCVNYQGTRQINRPFPQRAKALASRAVLLV